MLIVLFDVDECLGHLFDYFTLTVTYSQYLFDLHFIIYLKLRKLKHFRLLTQFIVCHFLLLSLIEFNLIRMSRYICIFN